MFGKKKKKPSDEAELEVMDRAEKGNAEVSVEKKGTFARLKKKFRIIMKFSLKRKKSSEEEDDSDNFRASGDGGKNKKNKGKKNKKEKKPKVKKPKKKKKKGSEHSGDGDNAGLDESPKRSKLLIMIIIAAGALVIGAAAFFVVRLIKTPSVTEQFLRAQLFMYEERYSEADEIYVGLIKRNKKLVDAYLGHAEILVINNDVDSAIESLRLALEPTSDDPAIVAKLNELDPPPPEATAGTTQPPPEPPPVPVSFSDSGFEKMLRMAMGKSALEQITDKELASITFLKIMGSSHASVEDNIPSVNYTDSYVIDGVTYTERGGIKSLGDLAYFTKIEKLVISHNSITDISGISGLEKLDTLGLYANDITDISALSELSSLEYLYIYNNRIRDLSPLSQSVELRQLWLNNNNISDISPLKNLTNLTELFLNSNEIKDISAVSGLKKLGFLYFNDNQVTDISAVRDATALTDISFTGNPIDDVSPASHVRNINRPYF